ncbi:hypothetical protein SVIO_068930 [Streptomyces violaceusniger]|uniref:Uncharacterized protein n=1 Tax=Streptomyces violaceusniger TaxID=68280 RepID=A0A4D4LB37_STRVO|nr:hypothetical protein SVIO_068930 [Streptomyces violaceusniger]
MNIPYLCDAGALIAASSSPDATSYPWESNDRRARRSRPCPSFYGRADARILTIPPGLCDELVDHPSVFTVSPLLAGPGPA